MIYQHIPGELYARLAKMEQEFIARFSSDGIIENALLLGNPSQIDLLQSCNAQYRHLLCEDYPKLRTATAQFCLGHFIDLPYTKESMDFIILPHTLEFSTEPQHILAEAAECLSQRGTLLLFSLSPFSRFVPLYRQDNTSHFSPPSSGTTKQWLTETGLHITASRSFFSPFSTLHENKFMRFLDTTLTPYLPFLCHAYLIVAQKTMTPLLRIPAKSYTTPRLTIALESGCTARSGTL